MTADRASGQGVPDGIYDTLKAAHPYSHHAGVTSTPDGRWIFLGEGGGLVVLDANLGQPGFEAPSGVKRFPLGRQGVIPAHLVLDPEAQTPPADGPEDLLYVAGGRGGLWAVAADTDPSRPNPAVRIDDSGNTDPTTQNSRRWCVAVGTLEIGGKWFLLALFQRRNGNRLRIYDLDLVRAAYAAGAGTSETGNEIAPVHEVPLAAHPAVTVLSTAEYGGSSALGMAVDALGTSDADVYVALGHHGLSRVHLHSMQLGVIDTPVVEWGPIFGDGSWYHLNAPADPDWYDHYRYLYKGMVQREERPVFVSVAVQNDSLGHYLYATVDHLGWVRFDLDGAWSDETPIDHHEGKEIPNTDDTQLQLANVGGNAQNRANYARAMGIVDLGPPYGPVLAVTTSYWPFVQNCSQLTEGYSVDSNTGLGRINTALKGAQVRTFLYRLEQAAGWTSGDVNAVNTLSFGGLNLYLPPAQSPASGKVLMLHNDELKPGLMSLSPNGTCRSEPWVDGQQGYEFAPLVRKQEHFTVRYAESIGYSVRDPNLLILGQNDAGYFEDGFLTTGTEMSVYRIKPTSENVPDRFGQTGIVTDQDCQWPSGAGATKQYVGSDGLLLPDQPPDDTGNPKHFKVMHWDVTTDPFGQAAGWDFMEWRKYMNTPKGRFQESGREEHRGITYSLAFEQAVPGLSDYPLFLSNGYPLSQGILVVPRDDLVENKMSSTIDGGVYNLDFDVQGGYGTWLRTHPEFDWMDPFAPDAIAWWKTTGSPTARSEANSAIYTWRPKVIRVEDPEEPGTLDHWVVAVPCGKVWVDPTWDVFTDDTFGASDWLPPQYWRDRHGRAMVQFWELRPDGSGSYEVVTIDTTDMVNGTEPYNGKGNSPLPRLFGPDEYPGATPEDQMAFRLDSVEIAGRVYLFVVDFSGKLLVSDVTSVLSGQPDTDLPLLATWEPPQSFVDTLPNNLHGIAIDKVSNDEVYVYVPVRRVGIKVLQFDPTPVPTFTEKVLIQTSEDPWTIVLRKDSAGNVLDLVVSDYAGGVKIYED